MLAFGASDFFEAGLALRFCEHTCVSVKKTILCGGGILKRLTLASGSLTCEHTKMRVSPKRKT